ncbi:unnamed protein product [Miscanthus lutarioriparius]|uniref:Scarecrow-like protein 9 n=1 Tax=Miscanthus lutarioriparius TaxID=422564 RepID=A0A811Q5R0_9POAL|nr:unnamed protein product [Miscanthus lutarioriparius]
MGFPPELELSEKRPQLNFTEPAPPSPSTYFLDQLPAPHVDNGKDDLSYISHMLLEDTIDSFLYQYPNHPAALLTAEQPFNQILSTEHGTSDGFTTWPCNSVQNTQLQLSSVVATPEYYSYCDNMDSTQHVVGQDASSLLMNSMQEAAAAEPNRLLPAAKSSDCCMDVISMAFFKGMEVANKLLPLKDSETTLARGRGWKKRLQGKDNDADVSMGRSSKQKVAQTQADSEEEAAARKMLDQLMLNDNASHAADVQQELIIGPMELEKPRGRRGAGVSHTAVDLRALLIRCAEAVATNDQQGAADLLQRIRRHSSPTGDGTQRLAHCFAQGLEARVMGIGSQMYQSLAAKSASAAGILKVYKLYMAACSILPLRFPLTNKTTYKAVAGRKKLHVVQYGLGPGFHWPDLLRMLSHREGGPPNVRLTGIDNPLPGFHPGQLIEETGRRLSDCARQFRVPFKFHAIAAKSEAVRAKDLDIDPEEVLVVISHFHFRTLMDESVIIDRQNPRDTVLKNIKKMRPKVFIHAILNGSYSGAFFVSRFREALNNFAALFDLIDTTVPQENKNTLLVEQELARCAMNIIACEGVDRVERPHNYKQWHVRCERAGLRQLPLDLDIVQASKDKVNKEYRKYFVINEDHGWLLKGWKG